MFRLSPIQLLLALAALASAQDSLLCNSNFASANATSSVASMNFNTAEVSIHSWAVTVASPSDSPEDSEVETSVWYEPGYGDYKNNSALGYDLCAFLMSELPENTNRLGGGGGASCGAMIPQSCQDALSVRARQEAERLTKDQRSISDAIPQICSNIAASFGDAEHTWPSECREVFGEERAEDGGYVGATVTSIAITGYDTSGLDSDCKLKGAGKSFDRVKLDPGYDTAYDEATRTSWPILSVYMPVALKDRKKSIGNVYTSLNCLRPDKFQGQSRVSPELPGGTANSAGRAGIASGAVVGVIWAASVLVEML